MTKKLKARSGKCENCGGIIVFNPKNQCLCCDSCGTIREFEKKKNVVKHNIDDKIEDKEYAKWVKQTKFINCENCGANIVLGQYEISKECPYCGSKYVSQIENLPGIKPDGIIPFAFNEEDASSIFFKTIKKKFFVPRSFKKRLPKNAVHGIYIPAFSFDADTVSKYKGKLIRTESDDDGSIEIPVMIDGDYSQEFSNILVETSSKISNYDLQQLSPFNMNGAYKFDINFIKGYSVEHYQEVLANCYDIARSTISDRIRKNILSEYNYSSVEYLDIDTKYSEEKYSYYLLPIYNFEYKYKKKIYTTQMNGQTGKIGQGLPVSGWKVGILIALGLLAVAGLTFLFYKIGTGF